MPMLDDNDNACGDYTDDEAAHDEVYDTDSAHDNESVDSNATADAHRNARYTRATSASGIDGIMLGIVLTMA